MSEVKNANPDLIIQLRKGLNADYPSIELPEEEFRGLAQVVIAAITQEYVKSVIDYFLDKNENEIDPLENNIPDVSPDQMKNDFREFLEIRHRSWVLKNFPFERVPRKFLKPITEVIKETKTEA